LNARPSLEWITSPSATAADHESLEETDGWADGYVTLEPDILRVESQAAGRRFCACRCLHGREFSAIGSWKLLAGLRSPGHMLDTSPAILAQDRGLRSMGAMLTRLAHMGEKPSTPRNCLMPRPLMDFHVRGSALRWKVSAWIKAIAVPNRDGRLQNFLDDSWFAVLIRGNG